METDFIHCQAWGKTAEFLGRYFSKGKSVVVEGDLRNNNYTDQNGVKHYGFVVNVQTVSFAGNKSDSHQAPQQIYNHPPQNNPQQFVSNAQGAGVPSGLDDLAGFEEIISDGDVPFSQIKVVVSNIATTKCFEYINRHCISEPLRKHKYVIYWICFVSRI